MKEIPVNELPGYSGPEEDGFRQFLYLERQERFDSDDIGPGEAFDLQHDQISEFLRNELAKSPRRPKWNPGGWMNEERVLELSSGEQLHCVSIHGELHFWIDFYFKYAKERNLILAEIGDGVVRILVGRTAGESLELAECKAYSTDGWRDGK